MGGPAAAYHGTVRARIDRASRDLELRALAAGKDASDDGCHARNGGSDGTHNGSITRGRERVLGVDMLNGRGGGRYLRLRLGLCRGASPPER